MTRRTTVLIVEDHPAVLEAMSNLIAEQTDMHLVGTASSVAESISVARDLGPDIVVMDYQLPDGTGDVACASIKESLPATKLIMVTRNDSYEARRKAANAGANVFLHKSEVASSLLGEIRKAAAA